MPSGIRYPEVRINPRAHLTDGACSSFWVPGTGIAPYGANPQVNDKCHSKLRVMSLSSNKGLFMKTSYPSGWQNIIER